MIDVRIVSRVVIATVLYYIVVVALLHFLQPDTDPVVSPLSAYVLTDSGALMTTAYFVLAVSLIGLVVGLRRVLRPAMVSTIGFILFSVAIVASATAGVFPSEQRLPPQTLSGIIHSASGAIFPLALAAAVILITLSVRRDVRWRGVIPSVTWLTVGIAISTLLFPIMDPRGAGGLAQRLDLALVFAWMIVVAYEMPKIATVVSAMRDHAVRS
jgi:uncharacterized protein DUF998